VSALELALRRIVHLLSEAGVPFALVGGLAVSVRVEPRFTRDADLAVAVNSDAEAEAVIGRLVAAGCRVIATVEQVATGRLATARLLVGSAPDAPVVDLLFASSGIEGEVVANAETLEILDGVRIPVAATAHLIAMKLLSRDDQRRPQDLIDLRGLIGQAAATDVARARVAIGLITARGFHRGRDLVAELQRVLPGG
jgi:predicted nucleotidyltransferase